jgi:type IV pilus assembly protein PilC
MPTFAYVAKTRDGSLKKGSLSAQSRQSAMQTLKKKGLIADPATVKEQGGTDKKFTLSKVKQQEIIIFTRQLATMVDSGLPLLQCLDILAEQTEDPKFAKILLAIAAAVEGGETLSESLSRFPRVFPELYVSMIRAGEASGDLDGVLLQLAQYMEEIQDLKRRVRGAMVYPVVSLVIILLIAAGLLLFVVPQFEKIFQEMGAQLPAPTQILIATSNALRGWGSVVVVGVSAAVFFGLKVYNRTESGRYNLDRLKLRIPVFGLLLRKVSVSRVTRTMSTLTRSGVPILQALEIVEATAGNEVFSRVIREAGSCVRNGEALADPLARSGEFPAMVTRMIGVGEKTGALEQMLTKISDFYDSEVKAMVDNLTSMIEPVLLVLMGIVVGGIIIALFLPIMSLSQIVS